MLADAERFALSIAGSVMCGRFPEVQGDDLVFTWDADGPEEGGKQPFIVRQGETVISRGVVLRGVVKRYIDIAGLLACRYGKRARDLAPTDAMLAFLVGNSAEDAAVVKAARDRLRAGWTVSESK